jgi:hypothetical protein
MAHKAGATDEDNAARLGLLGMMAGLAAEAIAESGSDAGRTDRIRGDSGPLSPRVRVPRQASQQHKSHYALMAAAMIRAGIYPDLLDEADGWGIEDMWRYAFYALVVYARIASERTGRSLEEIAAALAEHRGLKLETTAP